MALAPGTRLGPYEILAPIGVGGMGEVYRARDTRLGREVAVKVLPASFSTDPDRLRRFEQEARAASALDHPNILTVHDVGTHEGVPYVVSELLEGATLREVAAATPLPQRKAVEYARQVAQGLAAAHEKGIAHRDLKPENIFITRDGRAKILDFGLAKLLETEEGGATLSGATQPGAVLGTAGYMAPEQVRGQPSDHRSDIFSFGAVLYEMISGRRAFQAETPAETMAAILKEDPPEVSNPAWDRIVRHCIEKDPAQRFQSARDLGFALEAMGGASDTGRAALPKVAGVSWRRRPATVGAVVAAALAGFIVAAVVLRGRATQPDFQLITYRQGTVWNARFSPDGHTVVYTASWDAKPMDVYTARREDPEARPLGLPGSPLLAVSSKGQLAVLTNARYLYQFHHIGTLALVPFGGGAPREILENVREADFAPDGETLAVARTESGKTRVDYPIGQTLWETAAWVSWLRVSPDGSKLAFFVHPVEGDDRGDVAVLDRSGRLAIVSRGWESGQGLSWSSKGDEIWFSAATAGTRYALYAITPAGRQRQVLRVPGGVCVLDIGAGGRVLLSQDSTHHGVAALLAGESRERDLSWLEGSIRPHFSPDGKFVAFTDVSTAAGPYYAACMRKLDGSPAVRLGEGVPKDVSPDGRWILSLRFSNPPEAVLLPVGPGQRRVLPRGNIEAYHTGAFFHDGSRVLFTANEPGRGKRVYVQDVRVGDPRPVTEEGVVSFDAAVAPGDQSFVAADSSGALVRMPVGGGAAPARIAGAQPGDHFLGWAGDGKRIFVSHPPVLSPQIFSVDLQKGSRTLWKQLEPANPVGLMPFRAFFATLTPDGKNVAYFYERRPGALYIAEGLR